MAALREMPLRSVLLTSGTLSPLESFAHELQLGFKYTLENPHVINPSQVSCTSKVPGPAISLFFCLHRGHSTADETKASSCSTCFLLQVWVGVVPTGPTGANLNSSYANRGSDK